MITLDIKTPVMINKQPLKAVEIRQLKFAEYAGIVARAVTNPAPNSTVSSGIITGSMAAQTTFILADGSRVQADEFKIRGLHRFVSSKIEKNLYTVDNDEKAPKGEIITDGDGVTTPILFKLGSPIRGANTTGDETAIEELEFMAKTYGEIENVIGESTTWGQAVALIRYVAKPVANLLVLPSWAVDQLSMSDGLLIMEKVLPRFLESPEE